MWVFSTEGARAIIWGWLPIFSIPHSCVYDSVRQWYQARYKVLAINIAHRHFGILYKLRGYDVVDNRGSCTTREYTLKFLKSENKSYDLPVEIDSVLGNRDRPKVRQLLTLSHCGWPLLLVSFFFLFSNSYNNGNHVLCVLFLLVLKHGFFGTPKDGRYIKIRCT